MTVDPATEADRIATTDILSTFVDRPFYGEEYLSRLRGAVREQYELRPIDAAELQGKAIDGDLSLKEKGRFLYLEPIQKKKIIPFVTIQTARKWVNFRIYVLLGMEDAQCEMKTLAIRFETDEGPGQGGKAGSHDYCHMQLCRSIDDIEASTPSWLPDSQPSVPLDAEDQVGLVLCMLVSLYGARHVIEKLDQYKPRSLSKHLKKVRALRKLLEAD